MFEKKTDILILGSGPAGYAAAIYAARANLRAILVSGPQPGGQLSTTSDVENYPGFEEVITGPWLMEQMRSQVGKMGVRVHEDTITQVDLSQSPVLAQGVRRKYAARALIIATGAQARWLGLPSEAEFKGFGVSGCAVCDGYFFKGKDVVVVGGGSTAVEEALFLARQARSVTMVHRRGALSAEPILQDRLAREPRVRVLFNHVVQEVLGEREPARKVTGVRLCNTSTQEVHVEPTHGVFVAIGHDPASALFEGQVDLDENRYIQISGRSTRTSSAYAWAAGDVADPHYRQAVTAAGMGCMAALEVTRYLSEQGV